MRERLLCSCFEPPGLCCKNFKICLCRKLLFLYFVLRIIINYHVVISRVTIPWGRRSKVQSPAGANGYLLYKRPDRLWRPPSPLFKGHRGLRPRYKTAGQLNSPFTSICCWIKKKRKELFWHIRSTCMPVCCEEGQICLSPLLLKKNYLQDIRMWLAEESC